LAPTAPGWPQPNRVAQIRFKLLDDVQEDGGRATPSRTEKASRWLAPVVRVLAEDHGPTSFGGVSSRAHRRLVGRKTCLEPLDEDEFVQLSELRVGESSRG